MLRSLHLEGVGPADQLDLELGERLNLLTGDNGLGKSFVLEVAWWALTGTWTDGPVLPRPGKEESARIKGLADLGSRISPFESNYNRVAQKWRDRFGRDMSLHWLSSPAGVDVPSWVPGLSSAPHSNEWRVFCVGSSSRRRAHQHSVPATDELFVGSPSLSLH
ncbi:AAA family ATPase [Sorangium sp. So ce1182]|uniref:AAA family ATPase n=1 Tax=Sorangium sp. So ce1182 TaxID=3133334 RepID=UPI003F5E9644